MQTSLARPRKNVRGNNRGKLPAWYVCDVCACLYQIIVEYANVFAKAKKERKEKQSAASAAVAAPPVPPAVKAKAPVKSAAKVDC